MSSHLKMPRPLKYKANLQACSFTLRKDQIDYIRRLDNASDFIRGLIDEYILSEDRPVGIIGMLAKLEAFKKRKSQILDSPEYYLDKTDYSNIIEMIRSVRLLDICIIDGNACLRLDGEDDYEYEELPMSLQELKDFGNQYGMVDMADEDEAKRYRIRHKQEFIEFFNNKNKSDKVSEILHNEVAEIEAEIEKLEELLSSATGK